MGTTAFKPKTLEFTPGDIRDNYRLERTLLGEGSYGTVKVAVRLADNQRCAVKIIQKSRVPERARLLHEISVMQVADHPNIVRLFECYEDFRYYYLVMELCQGGELFDKLISLGSFNEPHASVLFRQMVAAVQFLHSHDIVHRDLKPENFLFLTKEPGSPLKLIDFGLAKVVQVDQLLQTKTGTAYYMSPQTLRGNYTRKCDVWALGVTLFMMLTGYAPFEGKSDAEIMNRIECGSPNYNPRYWDKISPEAKDLVTHMLAPREEDRPTTAEVMKHPWLQLRTAPKNVVIDCTKLLTYQQSKGFRKAVLNYLASQCSTSELIDIIQVFQSLDTDSDGNVNLEDLQQALGPLELPLDSAIAQGGKMGTMNFSEFLAAMLDRRIFMNEEKLWHAFKHFDKDSSGKISANELRAAIDLQNEADDSEIWAEMINEVDFDGDGEIDFNEFVRMMERASASELKAVRQSISID